MSENRHYAACLWGSAALYCLWHAIVYRSTAMLVLSAAFASSLVVFLWWMVNRAALEHRIRRIEARSEIAAEKRVAMRNDLSEVEHKLERVEISVAGTAKSKTPA